MEACCQANLEKNAHSIFHREIVTNLAESVSQSVLLFWLVRQIRSLLCSRQKLCIRENVGHTYSFLGTLMHRATKIFFRETFICLSTKCLCICRAIRTIGTCPIHYLSTFWAVWRTARCRRTQGPMRTASCLSTWTVHTGKWTWTESGEHSWCYGSVCCSCGGNEWRRKLKPHPWLFWTVEVINLLSKERMNVWEWNACA